MTRLTIFLTLCLLQLSFIRLTNAGECCVHNSPNYLSVIEDENIDDDQEPETSALDFSNNLATLLGLTPTHYDKPSVPFFHSSRSLEMPQSTWLFHVRGVDRLFGSGIPLNDNDDFDIEEMHKKLTAIGNGNELVRSGIVLDTQETEENLRQRLKKAFNQLNNEQASLKYLDIDCVYCNSDEATKQVQTQLNQTIREIVAKDPKTLILTLSTQNNQALTRRRRQAGSTPTSETRVVNANIAIMYSTMYPAIFNIFFWTSLALVLTLIAIVYTFLTLDPGSDTIIYRMTAPRPKVD